MTSAKRPAQPSTIAPDPVGPLDPSLQAARLAAIVESSDDAIVSKTLDGLIQSWNSGATRIFGYLPDEVIGKPITVIIPPELHAEEARILERLRRGEKIEHFDTTRVTKDGRRLQISLTVSPIRDHRGVVVGASKIARDVSERKRFEQILLENERRLAAEVGALRRLHEWSTRLWRSRDLEEGLREILTAAVELLAADKGVFQLVEPDGTSLRVVAQHGFQQSYLDSLADSSALPMTCHGRALCNGERAVIEDVEQDAAYAPLRERAQAAGYRAVVATPLLNAEGTTLAVISTHFREVHRPAAQELRRLDLYLRQAGDFIQRSKLEERLRQNEAMLRHADQRKNEFLALLAHELRNPLAAIRYALGTSRSAQRSPEQQRLAEQVIERQVAHMSRLLDDLLDISRITHGTLELKLTPTDLAALIHSAVETARPLLEARQHRLSVTLPAEPVQLEVDSVRMSQVFSNLLINAAKYTPLGGQISLTATQQERELTIAIRDSGVGISAQMMPRLFTLFSQERALQQPTVSDSGLGVGLALVRALVTLHGGTVEAYSAGLGAGSVFTVRLPLGTTCKAAQSNEVTMASSPVKGMQILVVDDNRDAADSCAMLLELSGYQARTAYSATQALDLGGQLRPHTLLLDIGLPDIDGYELARRVRATDWGRGALLIAVTGWGQESDRKRALEAGFDHHLTKPIAPEALTTLLESAASGAHPSA
jgi:PAS domain S-box-containing protein